MTKRLTEIFSHIEECFVFADVGCDHGYIAKQMLTSRKCKKVIISDVSAKCLSKAEELLREEIDSGSAVSVVSNGFEKLPECDTALIAGMGGEEIISILKSAPYYPQRLVLQPMKNSDKVRVALIEFGYKIVLDYTFFDGDKFYDLIKAEKGKDTLNEKEITFGRTNILERPQAFIEKLKQEKQKLTEILSKNDLSVQTAKRINEKIKRINEYV